MDSLKAIYKILERLEKAQDEEKPEFSDISATSLGIGETRWVNLIIMMQDARLIKDVSMTKPYGQEAKRMIFTDHMKITLDGLKWLEENSATTKILRAAKEIKDLIPGI